MKKLIPPLPAATLPLMKISFQVGAALLALMATATASALADMRMQVAAASTPIYAQASSSAQKVGSASSGEILFVSRVEGDWAAISPPDRLDLWLNKDFIEGNRVVAKSIQIRSGPGIEYGIVGTLERGAPVMPRGEDGEWCKIAPPSSTVLWVKNSDLSEVRTHTTPIQEVAPVPEAPKPAPPPAPAPQPAPATIPPAPQPEPVAAIPVTTPAPAPLPVAPPAAPKPPAPMAAAKVAPSQPNAPVPPVARPAPPPVPVATVAAPARPITESSVASPRQPIAAAPAATASVKPQPSAPRTPATVAPAAATLRPATAIPGAAPRTPAATNAAVARPSAPAKRPPAMPAVSKSVPTTPGAVASQKPKDLEVKVDQAYVDDLNLADLPNQGKSVQVEGELRNAPFMAASPSRYRLQARDEDGALEMVCHVHGDSEILRDYVGQGVSIRGREYWVEESDMPVVVVGQIVPLAPADEPVMF